MLSGCMAAQCVARLFQRSVRSDLPRCELLWRCGGSAIRCEGRGGIHTERVPSVGLPLRGA
eukprot:95839-Pyramimonas_sp.AAC.1